MSKGSVLWVVVVLCVAGCGGGGAGPDSQGPAIVGGPSSSNVTSTGASIQWSTDTPCDSKVEYGKTTAYSDSSVSDQLVLEHAITLSNLAQETPYHYRVSSRDENGKAVVSADRTFLTLSLAQDLVIQGWLLFESRNYPSAVGKFQQAHAQEPHNVAVLEGLGWALLESYQLEAGRVSLEEALSLEPARLDCLVAGTLVYQGLERYAEAIATGEQALWLGGSSYVFAHDPEVTSADVRYCVVISLMATGDLTGALGQAKVLDPSIDLDPADPSTWNGRTTFEEALLAVVEALRLKVS